MKRILAVLALLCITSVALAADQPDSGPAIKAAQAWVALVDAGNYAESWKQAAPLFQQHVKQADWVELAGKVRGPLGKEVKRSAPDTKYATQLPGAPDGHYWIIQDTADFEHQTGVTELVTLMQTPAGWQMIGYHLR